MRLAGKCAIVTGAGQGIGRAIALAYAAEGAEVLAISRTASKLEALVDEQPRIRVAVLDVADPAAEARVAHRPVDILVNCAGHVAVGTVLSSADADWDVSWQVNVMAPMRMIRAVLPGMITQGGGAIINVASVASSITGVKDRAAYGASKAALIGLTKAVARDHVSQGIRCNALCPVRGPPTRRRWESVSPPRPTPRAPVRRFSPAKPWAGSAGRRRWPRRRCFSPPMRLLS